LADVRITAAVHCAPPDNKPTTEERRTCQSWLDQELAVITPDLRVVVALGGLAWQAATGCLRRAGWQVPSATFGHGRTVEVIAPSGGTATLIASYHPSQQNTFTGRLTEAMLEDVLESARRAARIG
jgi:uracil-DNA glycosylase family 4